ncbi:hypothetical protein L6452_00086 [Arctium lappa]|uniref:Uncharacterized protein n=1 Tax=Arctium lappa TaxID=4217 RepID=A0ACB9FCW2_ARCLA|nr:hypothetical protein L6452_00086 [Arctium lappa]
MVATASLFPVSSPQPDFGAKNSVNHGGGLGTVDVRGIKTKSGSSRSLQVKANAQALQRIVDDGFIFRQNFSIRAYEIGADRTASVGTLMNHLQETTLNHVKNVGLLRDGFGSMPEMCKKNLFWVVTKIQVLVDRYLTCSGNPFDPKVASKEFDDLSQKKQWPCSFEDENENLHAYFIDEDSQLPSRNSKPDRSRNHSSPWSDEEMEAHTGSSICVLRLMDKYVRLIQRLDIVNVEFFKQNTNPGGKGLNNALGYRLTTALSRIWRDCDQWVKSPSTSYSSSTPLYHTDVAPNGILNSNL